MTVIEKARKKVDTVLEAAKNEYDGVLSEIEAYTLKRDQATAELDKARTLSEYEKAKEHVDAAEVALKMYNDRKERLETDALLSEKEYSELTAGVIGEVDAYIENLREEMFTLSETLEAKQKEAAGMIDNANKLLHELQYSCNRGRDLEYRGNLTSPDASSVLKTGTRDQWEVVRWSGELSETYHTMKKQREAAANE